MVLLLRVRPRLELEVETVLELAFRVADETRRPTEVRSIRLRGNDVVGGTASCVPVRNRSIGVDRSAGAAVHVSHWGEVSLVSAEVRVVQGVEEIQAELKSESLLKVPVLVDREVRIDQLWTMTDTARSGVGWDRADLIADQGEGIRIDDLISTRTAAVAALSRGEERTLPIRQTRLEERVEAACWLSGKKGRAILADTALDH